MLVFSPQLDDDQFPSVGTNPTNMAHMEAFNVLIVTNVHREITERVGAG